MHTTHDIRSIAEHFPSCGEFQGTVPWGKGHINDTYCAEFNRLGASVRFIFQRVNRNVFRNPVALMENVERVTAHLASKLNGHPDAGRRALRLVRTGSGCAWHVDDAGNHWRVYPFITAASTYDSVRTPEQAFQAAKAFGHFQKMLADLPSPRLHDTIPDFHHTPKRLAALENAIEADAVNRAHLCREEIQFAFARKSIVGRLLEAQLPERVTHNDTKLNNVMLDDVTGEGICVLDLDTVMPGVALYDFGDMVRTATSPAAEDERDLSKVTMRFPMFEALVRGYLGAAGDFLTPDEAGWLAFSGKLITFETGLRFLTDFLAGDGYFKTHREFHNLDRCRTQFRLVESIELQEKAMQQLVEEIGRGRRGAFDSPRPVH